MPNQAVAKTQRLYKKLKVQLSDYSKKEEAEDVVVKKTEEWIGEKVFDS